MTKKKRFLEGRFIERKKPDPVDLSGTSFDDAGMPYPDPVRKRGRPPKDPADRATERVEVRMTKEQKDLLLDAAGGNVSEYVRDLQKEVERLRRFLIAIRHVPWDVRKHVTMLAGRALAGEELEGDELHSRCPDSVRAMRVLEMLYEHGYQMPINPSDMDWLRELVATQKTCYVVRGPETLTEKERVRADQYPHLYVRHPED